MHSGFSQTTCLPASALSIVICACSALGAVMVTISISGSRSIFAVVVEHPRDAVLLRQRLGVARRRRGHRDDLGLLGHDLKRSRVNVGLELRSDDSDLHFSVRHVRVSGDGAVADPLAFRIVEEHLALAVRAHRQIDRSHHLVAHVGVAVRLLARPDAIEEIVDMLLVAFVPDALDRDLIASVLGLNSFGMEAPPRAWRYPCRGPSAPPIRRRGEASLWCRGSA